MVNVEKTGIIKVCDIDCCKLEIMRKYLLPIKRGQMDLYRSEVASLEASHQTVSRFSVPSHIR